ITKKTTRTSLPWREISWPLVELEYRSSERSIMGQIC
ncbi:unnamed protein product, partial [Allacma fusca]